MQITKSISYVLFAGLTRVVSFAAILALLVSGTPLSAQSYIAINLGEAGSAALSINNSGQVVGYSQIMLNGQSVSHATLFSGTGSDNMDLGTLGGTGSSANSINDAGQIVGFATLPGDNTGHATLFSGTGSGNIDLGTLGGSSSNAHAINNSGQIVGEARVAGDSAFRATLFSGTGTGNADLGTLGGQSSSAKSINEAGQIVGFAETPDLRTPRHATLFSGMGSGNTDLGTLGGQSSSANSINEAGQIVGVADTLDVYRPSGATIFSGTGSGNIDLGTLPRHTAGPGRRVSSEATAINNSGLIVGNSFLITQTGMTEAPGFISSGGALTELITITSGADSFSASSINDWGQIVGTSNYSKATLLNPVDPVTSTSGGVTNIKFVGTMAYERFAGKSETGGLGTTVEFLGGSAGSGGSGPYGSNRNVNLSFTGRGSNSLASDMVSLSGTAGATFADVIVLHLTYDESAAIALFGSESAARLGWFDPLSDRWTLAVTGNRGGSPSFAGDGAYDPFGDFVLGYYGVDTANNTVWAVVNHDSIFAVVPEPSSFVLLGLGAFLLILNHSPARRTGT